jgi:shikimate dehydrogenase
MNGYGLIGYPLEHSFSAAYFKQKFIDEHRQDCSYENFALPDVSHVREWLLKHEHIRGFNVTAPHKEAIIGQLDHVDALAKSVQAVNCVARTPRGWEGFNTDVYGFERSIIPFLENRFERALILGTGGAAKAAEFVLKKLGLQVLLVSRQPKSDQIGYEDLAVEGMKHFKLIIQCTPLGTSPAVDQRPNLPYDGIGPQHLLYDMVYNPSITAFLSEGLKRGAQVMNGHQMLKLQADRSWEIWKSFETERSSAHD